MLKNFDLFCFLAGSIGATAFYSFHACYSMPPLSIFPTGFGFPVYWAIALIGAAVAVARAFGKRGGFYMMMGVLALPWLSMVIVGGHVRALMATLILVGITMGLGRGLLLNLLPGTPFKNWTHCGEYSLSYFIGFIAMSLFSLLQSLLQLLHPGYMISCLAGLAFLSLFLNFRLPAQDRCEEHSMANLGFGERLLVSVPSGALIVALALACVRVLAPDCSYDSLNYHLATPAAFLAHGGYYPTGAFHSGLAHNVESIYQIALFLGESGAAQLTAFSFTIATLFACYEIGYAEGGVLPGLLTASLVGTTPLLMWEMPNCGNDSAAIWGVAVTLRCLLAWWRDGDSSMGWLGTFCLGSTLSIKLNTAFVLLPVCALSSVLVFYRSGALQGLWKTCGFAFVVLLMSSPYHIVSAWYLGNPVFPFANEVFKSPFFQPISIIAAQKKWGLDRDFFTVLFLPFTTISCQAFGDHWPRGAIGASTLLAAFSVILWRRWSPSQKIFAFLAVSGVGLWGFFNQLLRLYMVYLPLVALIVSLSFQQLWKELDETRVIRLGKGLMVLLVTSLFFAQIPPSMWCIETRNIKELPFAVAVGKETRHDYLRRKNAQYGAHEWLMTNATDGLILGYDHLRFYSPPGKYFFYWEWPALLQPDRNIASVGAYLKDLGFRYIVWPSVASTGIAIEREEFLPLQKRVYVDDSCAVYQLR